MRVRVEGQWYPVLRGLDSRLVIKSDRVYWVSYARVSALTFGQRRHLRTRDPALIQSLCSFYPVSVLARTILFPRMVLPNQAVTQLHPLRGRPPVYRRRLRLPENRPNGGDGPHERKANPNKGKRTVCQLCGCKQMVLVKPQSRTYADVAAQRRVQGEQEIAQSGIDMLGQSTRQEDNPNPAVSTVATQHSDPSPQALVLRSHLYSTLSSSPKYLKLLMETALLEQRGMSISSLHVGELACFGVSMGMSRPALSALRTALSLSPSQLYQLFEGDFKTKKPTRLTVDYVTLPPNSPSTGNLRLECPSEFPTDTVPPLSSFPRQHLVRLSSTKHLFTSLVVEGVEEWPCGCSKATTTIREVDRVPIPSRLTAPSVVKALSAIENCPVKAAVQQAKGGSHSTVELVLSTNSGEVSLEQVTDADWVAISQYPYGVSWDDLSSLEPQTTVVESHCGSKYCAREAALALC